MLSHVIVMMMMNVINYCSIWRCEQVVVNSLCKLNIRRKRNVEEDGIACVVVYYMDLPPLKDVKQDMRISEKKHDVVEDILWKLASENVDDVKANSKLYQEQKNKCQKYNKRFTYFC